MEGNEYTCFEWTIFAGRALTDASVQPFAIVLSKEIVDELEKCNPEFWIPLLDLIAEDIRECEEDEAAAD